MLYFFIIAQDCFMVPFFTNVQAWNCKYKVQKGFRSHFFIHYTFKAKDTKYFIS